MKRSPIRRRSPIKHRNAQRRKAEFARTYESPERIAWMRRQPCTGCGQGPCEGHHVTNGGHGRKASADCIVPLCARCHRLHHDKGLSSWWTLGRPNLLAVAREIDAAFRAVVEQRSEVDRG